MKSKHPDTPQIDYTNQFYNKVCTTQSHSKHPIIKYPTVDNNVYYYHKSQNLIYTLPESQQNNHPTAYTTPIK